MSDTSRHLFEFGRWMARQGYAKQTCYEYPHFLQRYVDAFNTDINARSAASEADVQRLIAHARAKLEHGGAEFRDFNERYLTTNLQSALRLHVAFVNDQKPKPSMQDRSVKRPQLSVSPLSSGGRRLLEAVVAFIKAGNVDWTDPATYPTYDRMYRAIVPNAPERVLYVGHNLRKKGLDGLNDWTMENAGLPKVTGLIVGGTTHRPGKGFFSSYGKTPGTDDGWWQEQVRASVEFDWSPFIGTQQATSPILVADDLDDDDVAPRAKGQVSRIVRDTRAARELKALYHHTCQLCGQRLELSPGVFYSEAHHLKPLGKPHRGPDKTRNMVCVCPTCHVKLDYHAIRIEADRLTLMEGHVISPRFIDHHNALCR